jgi:hypothetical protein|tara:strand:- start:89 stop:301 length:213 start_codon:yes stop_codon:yes gene_type:complete
MPVVAAVVQSDLIGTLMGDHMKEDQQLMEEVLVPMQMELLQHILVKMELKALAVVEVAVVPITQQSLFQV